MFGMALTGWGWKDDCTIDDSVVGFGFISILFHARTKNENEFGYFISIICDGAHLGDFLAYYDVINND